MNINVTSYLHSIRQRPDTHFMRLMEALHGIQDSAERERLVVSIFGEEGIELLPLIQNWKMGTKELIEMDIFVTSRWKDILKKVTCVALIVLFHVIVLGFLTGRLIWTGG